MNNLTNANIEHWNMLSYDSRNILVATKLFKWPKEAIFFSTDRFLGTNQEGRLCTVPNFLGTKPLNPEYNILDKLQKELAKIGGILYSQIDSSDDMYKVTFIVKLEKMRVCLTVTGTDLTELVCYLGTYVGRFYL